VAILAIYGLLAGLSGRLSPLDRRPLLDGFTPLPYRWVNPPPNLAPTNQEPSSAVKSLKLTAKGVTGDTIVTSDLQATVIIADGVIAPHGDDTTVKVSVTPVDPGTLSDPGDGVSAFGNAYRVRAVYQPSKASVKHLAGKMDVALLYPITVPLHAATHELLSSRDGRTWDRLDSNDAPTVQQVEALVPTLGYVMAGGTVTSSTASTSSGGGGASSSAGTMLLVAAAVVLLIGIGLLLRSRRT
jgi:hypothetical protein